METPSSDIFHAQTFSLSSTTEPENETQILEEESRQVFLQEEEPPEKISCQTKKERAFREEEERLHQSRAFLQNLYPDRLYFPPEDIPSGAEYRWIREEVQGSPDVARVTLMTRKGWTPVPASRHPTFLSDRTWKTSSSVLKEDVIRVQGLILCERPKELGTIEQESFKAINERTMKAVNWTGADIGFRERRVFENSVSVGGAKA